MFVVGFNGRSGQASAKRFALSKMRSQRLDSSAIAKRRSCNNAALASIRRNKWRAIEGNSQVMEMSDLGDIGSMWTLLQAGHLSM
jgi:hypothetical protein